MGKIFAALIIVFLFFASAASAAQTGDDVRIKALEQRIESMQKTYISNNQQVASALARSQSMTEEFSELKGAIESNKHLFEAHLSETAKIIDSLDHRIQAIEERLEIFSSQLAKALGKVAPKEAEEAELYQEGLDHVNQAKYLEAAASFTKFTEKFGSSQFAPSAWFWIGESFYSMRDYRRAIKEFQTFIEKYPRDAKVSEAILKQGNSFYELGMPDEAKAFYDKVLQKYPGSTSAVQAKSKIDQINDRKAKEIGADVNSFGSYPALTLEQKRKQMQGQPIDNTPSEESSDGGRRNNQTDF